MTCLRILFGPLGLRQTKDGEAPNCNTQKKISFKLNSYITSKHLTDINLNYVIVYMAIYWEIVHEVTCEQIVSDGDSALHKVSVSVYSISNVQYFLVEENIPRHKEVRDSRFSA